MTNREPEILRTDEEIVTFWDITRRQYAKNRAAVIALLCVIGLVLAAMAAPLITMNIPYVMKNADGLSWPLFDHLFNRLIFPSGVDIFFNLLLLLGPLWWLGGQVARSSGLEGKRDKGRLLWTAIPLGAEIVFLITLTAKSRGIYGLLLVFGLIGLGLLAWQSSRVPTLLPRHARKLRMRTRYGIAGLFLVVFIVTLTVLEFTSPITVYREEIAKIEANGEGWALKPPIFYHPDNKAEARELIISRFLKEPSWERRNILGTDNNGRDVFSRILFGTRISLTIGIIAVSIYVTIGVILGSLAGYLGGRTDMFILFVVQVMICIPTLFLILTIVAVFESRSIFMIMMAIGLVGWTGITRIVRGEFLRQRGIDYVTAARALGIPPRRIIFGHILKNALSPVLVAAAFGVASAILIESFLAFIGLGDTNAPSWGQLLQEGRNLRKSWLIWAPGMAIFFVVTILNMVGDGLRDALDPKLRQ